MSHLFIDSFLDTEAITGALSTVVMIMFIIFGASVLGALLGGMFDEGGAVLGILGGVAGGYVIYASVEDKVDSAMVTFVELGIIACEIGLLLILLIGLASLGDSEDGSPPSRDWESEPSQPSDGNFRKDDFRKL